MAATILRVRSRDGIERVTIENPHTTTVWHLKTLIQSQLGIPIHLQTLSTDRRLLLAKTSHDLAGFAEAEAATLASLGLSHGSFVFLLYAGERTLAGPTFTPAGSFGRKMTVADLSTAERIDADLRRAKAKTEALPPRPIPVSDDRGLHQLFAKLCLNNG